MEFDDFYAAHYHRVLSFVAVVVGNVVEAEDITQEAFERAHRHWPRIRGYEDPEGWLRRVAYNLSLNTLRRARRKTAALVRLAGRAQGVEPAIAPELVDLRRALAKLPVKYRVVLTMRYLLDLPVRQIAVDLELPEETVKSQLARGRERLRGQLKQGWGDESLTES